MTDREKVIYSIERCVCHVPDACRDCNYDNYEYNKCVEKLLWDSLELLKAQEPMEPRYEMIYGDKVAFCGNCDTYLGSVKYCPKCGRAVKWDG